MRQFFTIAFLITYFFSYAQEYNFTLAVDLVTGTEGIQGNYFHFEKDGLVYLIIDTDGNGEEIWTSDGTAEGTQKLLDLPSGNSESSPSQFTFLGDKIFYTAEDTIHGREPWITDLTEEGTFMLKDIYEGPESSSSYTGIVYNEKLYFVANTLENYKELWVTDGSSEGTQFLKIVCPNCSKFQNSVAEFYPYLDKFIFKAEFDVHISDGTTEGTEILYDHQAFTSVPFNGSSSIVYVQDSLIFNSHYLKGLFVANGNPYGNRLIHEKGTGVRKMQVFDNKIFYLAEVNNGGGWKYDLYYFDMELDSAIRFYPENVYSKSLFSFDNRIYFRDQNKLYSSNGEISDLQIEYEEYSWEHLKPIITDNYLVIAEFDKTFIKKKGADMVKVAGVLSDPFIYNEVLYGTLYENETGRELYKLDLSTFGTSGVENKWVKINNMVYPNPTSGFVTFENVYIKLEIFDLSGNRVGIQNSYKANIDLNNYQTGMYLFKIYSEGGISIQKVYKN